VAPVEEPRAPAAGISKVKTGLEFIPAGMRAKMAKLDLPMELPPAGEIGHLFVTQYDLAPEDGGGHLTVAGQCDGVIVGYGETMQESYTDLRDCLALWLDEARRGGPGFLSPVEWVERWPGLGGVNSVVNFDGTRGNWVRGKKGFARLSKPERQAASESAVAVLRRKLDLPPL
jgi:hypothetical protein